MLGKTHIAVGVATSLAILRPTTPTGVVGAIAGGAIGGWLCDIDLKKRDIDAENESLVPNLILTLITAGIALFVDYRLGNGVCEYTFSHWGIMSVIGLTMLLLGCMIGLFSAHRTFTHSIFAALFLTGAVGMICLPIAPAFLVGYLSHILIDLLNLRGEQIFFPLRKRFCFGVCDSDGAVNFVLFSGALIASIVMAGWFSVKNFPIDHFSAQYGAQGILPWLTKFQWYLLFINVLSFLITCIDHWVCTHTAIVGDENFVHTIEDILGLAGGGLGMLLAFIILREWIGKNNANWYAIVISQTVCWAVIYCMVCDPFDIGMNGVSKDISSHLPLIVYLIAINIITAIVFILDRETFRPKWKLGELGMFLLGVAGGALGGYIVMVITGKKLGSPHFGFGFPMLILMQVFLIAYLLLAGIA